MEPIAETAVLSPSPPPARPAHLWRWWGLPFLFGCLAALIWVVADGP
ncbi:MAG: hypothetical protein IPM39_18605 [Chloroflexi bacterium]|nr:hypothetical protein [Chloroflexota bacterium]